MAGPYTETDEPNPQPPILFLRTILILSSNLWLEIRCDIFFLQTFPSKPRRIICSPMPATCSAHLVPRYVIILMIQTDEHNPRCSSEGNFLEPPVNSSRLLLRIPLITPFPNNLSLCSSFNAKDQFAQFKL